MYDTMPEIRDLPGCQGGMAEFDDSKPAHTIYHQCIGSHGHDFGHVCKCGRRWNDLDPQPSDGDGA